jgi:hypothetical protein
MKGCHLALQSAEKLDFGWRSAALRCDKAILSL